MNNVTELLHSVDKIRTRYNEIARLTGENYNLFEILNVETKEYIHTYFLADMLNPKGIHGLGNLPLKLFLQEIEKDALFSDDLRVFAEKDYGVIDKQNTLGGRIDISLENLSGKSILIENKIYARDQENQLLRYYNTFKDRGDSFILYLTLDGKTPTDQSITNTSKEESLTESDYLCISYKDHIIKWLKKCHKKAIDLPLLRETLKQYIALINILTGNSTNRKMSKEIGSQLAQSKENIENAYAIASSINSMKDAIIQNFFDKIKKNWSNGKWELTKWEADPKCSNFWRLTFSNENSKYPIEIGLEENIYYLGIVKDKRPELSKDENEILKRLKLYKQCGDIYDLFVWTTYDFGGVVFKDDTKNWVYTNDGLCDHVIKELGALINYIEKNNIEDLIK